MPADWIIPDWPAPGRVQALSTLRTGGFSQPPWDSFNLGDHVEDKPDLVAQNRARLVADAHLPAEPLWMEQIHGCDVLADGDRGSRGDARFSNQPKKICVVMTADCLPVLLCDTQGTAVAAVHAGWRGLAGGVLEQALCCFDQPASAIMAWLGPAIGPTVFEVGDEVREVFMQQQTRSESAFQPHAQGKWLVDIYELARQRLYAQGLAQVHGGGFCTYTDSERFFSYRRDGRTGRMASLIWLEE